MKAIEEDKEVLHRTPTGRIPAIKRPYTCKYVVECHFSNVYN